MKLFFIGFFVWLGSYKCLIPISEARKEVVFLIEIREHDDAYSSVRQALRKITEIKELSVLPRPVHGILQVRLVLFEDRIYPIQKIQEEIELLPGFIKVKTIARL